MNEETKMLALTSPQRVGIDIGRVIMAPTDLDGRADTSFLHGTHEDAMATPPSADAFRVIGDLVAQTRGKVWLVSKAGPRIQKLTLEWLLHWDFYATTGVNPDQVRFCRERREKAVHAKRLGLTHFIDDRLDVLSHLTHIVDRLYLFGHQKPGTVVPRWATRVATWFDVERKLSTQSTRTSSTSCTPASAPT
jgi:hypothetical protein